MIKSNVSIFKTSPSSLKSDLGKVFKLSYFKDLNPQKKTLIKINGNCDKYYPGSNTSPWFLDALLFQLKKRKFKDINIIEGDLFEFSVEKMLKRTFLVKVLEHNKVGYINYEKLPRDDSGLPLILKKAQIINVPVLHTHGFAKISCATKNMWGFLPVTRRHLHKCLNEKLIEIYKKIPLCTIVDGTVGLYGDSTRTGLPRKVDLILAGWDTFTIDMVATLIMGFSEEEIPLLVEARKRKLLKNFKLFGDFNIKNLPQYDFSYKDSLERRLTYWLEGISDPNFINELTSFLLHSPIIDPIYNYLRMFYNNFKYSVNKEKIFKGEWTVYEEVVPYINFRKIHG